MLQETERPPPVDRSVDGEHDPEAPNLIFRTATPVGLARRARSAALAAIAASVVVHIAFAVGVVVLRPMPGERQVVPVKLKIYETKKPEPPPPPKAEPKPVPPPPKPKEQPKKKPKPKKAASERKPPAAQPAAPPKPIQGLAPTALTPGAHGIAVPVGNTLMTEDDGKRVKPDEVKPLSDEDLTADAKFIPGTITAPKYTDDAIDADLQGTMVVDVFVDEHGTVTQAELRKKVGYDMDQRILDAAKKARFQPRKDRYGRSSAGWTEIKFRLEIPG